MDSLSRVKVGGSGGGSSSGDLPPAAERALERLAAAHPEGLSAPQIVEAFLSIGVPMTEATFRKWVQLGLLPRSRRVGRKGKHQGSLGLYPTSTLRRIAEVRRLMGESLTIEDIQRVLRFQEEIDAVERGLGELLSGLAAEIAAPEAEEGARAENRRALGEVRKTAGELLRRLRGVERRVVEPLVRSARARAFGSGGSRGAGDLL